MSVARYTRWLAIVGVVALVVVPPFVAGGVVVVALGWLVVWAIGVAWLRLPDRIHPVLAVTVAALIAAFVIFAGAPWMLGALGVV
jgi:hypothetical protein